MANGDPTWNQNAGRAPSKVTAQLARGGIVHAPIVVFAMWLLRTYVGFPPADAPPELTVAAAAILTSIFAALGSAFRNLGGGKVARFFGVVTLVLLAFGCAAPSPAARRYCAEPFRFGEQRKAELRDAMDSGRYPAWQAWTRETDEAVRTSNALLGCKR